MEISPDKIVIVQFGPLALNATILCTWIVMALIAIGSALVTRRLTTDGPLSRGQNLLEVVVGSIREQIREVTQQDPDRYLPFIGTLFLFIAVSNTLAIIPGFAPPTGSLSTTAALALCVFVAVPIFGILEQGFLGYLKNYIEPTPFMLPFNIIGELSRTLALAVRLFGNVMSGTMIAGTILAIAPFFFPVLLQVLGLITGLVQAYIFAILALVYIASATRAHTGSNPDEQPLKGEANHG